MEKFIQIIKDKYSTLACRQKHQLAIALTIAFSLILTLSVLLPLWTHGRENGSPAPQRISIISPIPPQELFYPEEPDYVPAVILGREQRSVWEAEDAAEYWQDPLMFGEEKWRERIEKAIDDLLERIP